MRPKAEWAMDSEAKTARGTIIINYCFSKISTSWSKKIGRQHLLLVKAWRNAIKPPLFWFSKPVLFFYS